MSLIRTVRLSFHRTGHHPEGQGLSARPHSQESFVVMPLSPIQGSSTGTTITRHRYTGSKDITDDPFSDTVSRTPKLKNQHDPFNDDHQYYPQSPLNAKAGPSSPVLVLSPRSDVFTLTRADQSNTYPPPSAFGLGDEDPYQTPLPRSRPRFSESGTAARKSWYHSITGNTQTRNSRFSVFSGFRGGGVGRHSFFYGDDAAMGVPRKLPAHFTRNASERGRLQGLMQWTNTPTSLRLNGSDSGIDEEQGLIRRTLGRLRVWMVNDGTLFWTPSRMCLCLTV
jgi:hypothetical protein